MKSVNSNVPKIQSFQLPLAVNAVLFIYKLCVKRCTLKMLEINLYICSI